ncbi:MAG: ABC transporter permease [Clostridia bacterium]|nr:ABC transporter permease [Clostridia bacterium]
MEILRERLRDFHQLTLIPTLRRMFGKQRWGNTLMLIAVFYLISAMLGVICFSHHVNLLENDRLAAEYEQYISSTASAAAEANQAAAAAFRYIVSSKIELNAVFFFFMTVWAILSTFALARVFHATVERDKYIYGLYVTFGSDTRRLRGKIHTEFISAALVASVAALPTAFFSTRAIYLANGQNFRTGLRPFFQIALLLTLVSLLGAGYLSRRITKSTCLELMAALDCSDYVSSPRSSRLFGKRLYNGSLRYARLAILRMRRYYIPLVLTVAVVAGVFFGSMNLALEGERASMETVHEYTVEFSRGVSAKDVQEGYIDHLLTVDAVDSVEALAHDSAERLGTHLLADSSLYRTEQDDTLVKQGLYLASDDIHLICADGDTRTELGGKNVLPDDWDTKLTFTQKSYNHSLIPEAGHAVYMYPMGSEPSLQVQAGDTVQLALPRGEVERALSDKLDDSMYEYLPITISEVVAVPDVHFVTLFDATPICPRIGEDYLLLNPADYAAVAETEMIESLSLDELYREDLRFADLNAPAALLVPEGYEGQFISTVQMFLPTSQVTLPYSVQDPLDSHRSYTLESEIFFHNRTAYQTYFYFGSAGDISNDSDAQSRMTDIDRASLSKYRLMELTVTDQIECPGLTEPCIILPNDNFLSSYDGDLCALQLTHDGEFWKVQDEVFLLGTAESLGMADYIGQTLFSHTKIEAGFFEAMREQGLFTSYPDDSAYELSAFTVTGMFDYGTSSYFVCSLSDDCNLGIDRYPAYLTPGDDFFFLAGTRGDTDLPLKETASYLMFPEEYRGADRGNAPLEAGNMISTNQLTVSLADGINAAILTPDYIPPTLAAGEAILIVRPDSPLAMTDGDGIRLAIRTDFTLDPNDPQTASLGGNALLQHMVESNVIFRHAALTVIETVEADITQDILYVSETDWQRINRAEGTYRTMDIYLYGDTDLIELVEAHVRIRALMGNWQGDDNYVSLIDHNRLWQTVTTNACNYPAIIRLLSILLVLLLPLLWCSPQMMHFHKRREEFYVMGAVGRDTKQQRRMIAAECTMITLAAGIFVALLCPFTLFCVQAAIYMMELPFTTSGFDVRAYLFLIFFVMLCSAFSFLMASRQLFPPKPKKETNEKGGTAL